MSKGRMSTNWVKRAMTKGEVCCPEASAFPKPSKENINRAQEFNKSQENLKNSQPE